MNYEEKQQIFKYVKKPSVNAVYQSSNEHDIKNKFNHLINAICTIC